MPTRSGTFRTLDWIDARQRSLEQQGLLRRRPNRDGLQGPRAVIDGREVVNFGSNDYLGLAGDPRLAEAAAEAGAIEGWGGGASPLLGGHGESHRRLEARLAEFEGTETALVFPTGFAANSGTIAALVGPGDVVFSDRKNHASLLDGCRLSRADFRVYPHNDVDQLDRLLARPGKHDRRLIVTDGLFSMDGDLAPLGELAEAAERHGAMLLVDEAHATGVFGATGRGAAEHCGVDDRVPVRIGTLSKALGCAGGFVAGSRRLVDWLVNRARPYIFSTAMPAPAAAAARAAIDIAAAEPQRRQGLLERARTLREELVEQGWNTGGSESQIIPLVVGTSARAVELSRALLDRGLFAPAIRPPTVPEGEACLRISLSSGHTPAMISELLAALRELSK